MDTNQEDKNKKKKAVNPLNSYAQYSGIVIQMIAIIGIGTFAGMKLDEHYSNEKNIFTITLSFISVLMALFFVVRRILASSKDS